MLDLIIYALMAWEATQSFNPLIAYINATGGGIIRSSVLGLLSSNFSIETVSSILFWNFVARFVVEHNVLGKLRSKLSKFKPLISSISSVIFGWYGMSVAPQLGWFAYYITACGGGILSSVIRSNNLNKTVKNIFIRTSWTFIEGIIISATSSGDFQIIWATIFIILRVILRELYCRLEGRNFEECIYSLKHIRMSTNFGKPVFHNHVRYITQNRNHMTAQKLRIRVYGCLCRRRVMLSF